MTAKTNNQTETVDQAETVVTFNTDDKRTSQSIFETLKTRTREVVLQTNRTTKVGYALNVTLPSWFPDDTTFESESDLIAWLTDTGLLLPVLQSGIAQELIKVWALAKPRGDEKPTSNGYPAIVQARIDGYVPEPARRPSLGKAAKVNIQACLLAVKPMTIAGIDSKTIHTYLDAAFGATVVARVLNELAAMDD